MNPTLVRRVVAEALGTCFFVAGVVGSGIMVERLAGADVALALLANTIATGAALLALILTFGPVSGAHLNPAVTLADASQGGLPWREVPAYIAAQRACDRRMFPLSLLPNCSRNVTVSLANSCATKEC